MKQQGTAFLPAVRTMGRLSFAAGILLLSGAISVLSAQAADDDAISILKAMSSYVASQKAISATYDADVEVITNDLQKIQFAGSGLVQLSRPDKLRVTRTGGYRDVEMIFDGKTITVNNKGANSFAQLNSPGSIDQVIDLLRDKYGVVAPGADLMFSNAFDIITEDVIDAKHIGRGVIDGVECEHLAFRNVDTDWQIWIEVGARPIPHKYVITSKAVAAAPQYTLRIKDWKADIQADTFAFTPAQGAKKVGLEDLDTDEIPQGVVKSGVKK